MDSEEVVNQPSMSSGVPRSVPLSAYIIVIILLILIALIYLYQTAEDDSSNGVVESMSNKKRVGVPSPKKRVGAHVTPAMEKYMQNKLKAMANSMDDLTEQIKKMKAKFMAVTDVNDKNKIKEGINKAHKELEIMVNHFKKIKHDYDNFRILRARKSGGSKAVNEVKEQIKRENDRADNNLTSLEGFSNDLPNQSPVFGEDIDYNETLMSMALEPSVISQHADYINDKNRSTNTASFLPSRSDSQTIVPFVGLRRPQYVVNNKDLVDNTARSVPSVLNSDQLDKPIKISWS